MKNKSSIVLLNLITIIGGMANAAAPFKICHVSSAVGSLLPRANDKNIQFGGFEVGIENFRSRNKINAKNVEFRSYQNATEILAVLDGLAKAKSDNCDLIVGLITSKDSLIAGPFLVENRMYGISSTATNDGISKYNSNLLSLSTSASSYVKSFTDWVKNNSLKDSEVAVIFKPTEVYSLFFKDEVKKKMPGIRVVNFNDLLEGKKAAEGFRGVKAIFITTYPLESIVILKSLKDKLSAGRLKDLNIFGTQSWTEVQAFSANPTLINDFKNVFMFSPWNFDNETPEFQNFRSKYKQKFGVMPDHDSVYDYDTVTFALKCAFDSKTNAFNRENLRSCFGSLQKFSGATGLYEFKSGDSHPLRQDFLFEYHKYINMRGRR
jgi:ABC-type branched-subunit amino acid transport system substrate-binding protein